MFILKLQFDCISINNNFKNNTHTTFTSTRVISTENIYLYIILQIMQNKTINFIQHYVLICFSHFLQLTGLADLSEDNFWAHLFKRYLISHSH